jgi:uncharacterized protein
MEKISKYNLEIDFQNGILLYNALTDKILPVSYKDYAILETLMEHFRNFQVNIQICMRHLKNRDSL